MSIDCLLYLCGNESVWKLQINLKPHVLFLIPAWKENLLFVNHWSDYIQFLSTVALVLLSSLSKNGQIIT